MANKKKMMIYDVSLPDNVTVQVIATDVLRLTAPKPNAKGEHEFKGFLFQTSGRQGKGLKTVHGKMVSEKDLSQDPTPPMEVGEAARFLVVSISERKRAKIFLTVGQVKKEIVPDRRKRRVFPDKKQVTLEAAIDPQSTYSIQWEVAEYVKKEGGGWEWKKVEKQPRPGQLSITVDLDFDTWAHACVK